MNKKILRPLSFVARHALASLVSVMLPVVFVVIVYFVLLVVAILTKGDWGGPLALPVGMALAGLAGITYTCLLLFPAVALAELFSRRFEKRTLVAEILISTCLLALFSFVVGVGLNILYVDHLLDTWVFYSAFIFLTTLIPLGVYWLMAKFGQLLITTIASFFVWIKSTLLKSRI